MSSSTTTLGTTSGAIHFTGLGNGTDFDSMITKLVEAEGYQVTRLQSWKKEWTDKVAAFQGLNTKMLDLKSTVEEIDSPNEFLAKNSVSSNEGVLTSTASSSASNGITSIVVNNLASNSIATSGLNASLTSSTSSVTTVAGSFKYTYGKEPLPPEYSISVPANTTLSQLSDMINGDPNNPGVRASVLQVGSGDYRLQLSGMDLGEDHQVNLSSNSTLDVLTSVGSTRKLATDAELQVNGFPSGGTWIHRTTNTITDLVAGQTLNLKSIGSSTLTTATDTEAIKENIKTFVDAVNTVRANILSLSKVDTSGGSAQGAILTGNYGIEIISSKLKDLTAVKALGFDYDADKFSSLGQIGISTDADEASATAGQLLLDETKLDAALAKDPDAVAALFSANYTGQVGKRDLSGKWQNTTDFTFHSSLGALDITQPGEYSVSYKVDDVAGVGVIDPASVFINGKAATLDPTTNTITLNTSDPAKGLTITVTNLTPSVTAYTGSVRLQLGKAPDLAKSLKSLTSSTDGPLAILQRNYHDITDSIDKKIEYEQKRISDMEKNLRTKFAKVDSLLNYYDNLQTQLTSNLGSLSSSSGSSSSK